MEQWQVMVAAYAAIVATGALFLEVRRWVEAGPKLYIDVSQHMQTFNMPGADGKEYLLVTVNNTGHTATTITHFAFLEFPNLWARFRRKQTRAAVIPIPGLPGMDSQLPFYLEPGKRWVGAALQDDRLNEWIATKRMHLAIYASNFRKPICRKVLPSKLDRPPEDAEQVEGGSETA